MALSIFSDITNIPKGIQDIEYELSKICAGEIIRWAIIDVSDEFYKISFSYKK